MNSKYLRSEDLAMQSTLRRDIYLPDVQWYIPTFERSEISLSTMSDSRELQGAQEDTSYGLRYR